MRIDAKLSLVSHSSVGREVKSVSGVHALKPLAINAYQTDDAARRRQHQSVNDDDAQEPTRQKYGAERRKLCRRVRQQTILMELRSGGDRRHLIAGDVLHTAHIDEEV